MNKMLHLISFTRCFFYTIGSKQLICQFLIKKSLKFFILCIFLIEFSAFTFAKENIKTKNVEVPRDIIEDIFDTPTGSLLPYGKYNLDFRIYNTGNFNGASVLTKLNFGFGSINLGLFFDIEKLIGQEQIAIRKPNVAFKLKILSGNDVAPALSVGFNQQGYGDFIKNNGKENYTEREKGLFLVMTKELFIKKMDFNIGINMYDFEKYEVYGFTGLLYELSEQISFLTEYDNIRNAPEARMNVGFKYFLTPEFSLSLFAKNVFENTRGIERVIRLNYEGVF